MRCRTNADFRAILKELGLTQREFAKIVDTDHTAVNRWALGKSKVPGPVWAYLDLRLKVKGLMDE